MPMKNNNCGNTTVLTIVLVGFMALMLTMAPSVYAAKSSSSGGGGGGGSSSSGGGGGSSKGGSDGGSSKSSENGGGGGSGDKGSSSFSSSSHDSGSDGGSSSDNPSHSNDNTKTVDDGFTSKDGPQPTFPIGKDGTPVKNGGGAGTIPHCLRNPNTNNCNPEDCSHIHAMCKQHDDHDHRHDDVKVVQKTVVVHDHNDTPQNIIITQNAQGTCFVTQSQILSIPNIVQQLLDQCTTVTITQG